MADSNLKTLFGEQIDMFWLPRESGSKGYRCVNGDAGNAMGAYQFDRRYALVPFMQYCVNKSVDHYSGFNKFIAYGAGSEQLKNNQELADLWLQYCDSYGDEFGTLQDEYAYKYYYTPAKEYAVKHGTPVDEYSPVLKGSLWSFAIRSGTETGAKKLANAYKSNSNKAELVILRAAYNTYGTSDANRWNPSVKSSQYGDASRIYKEKYAGQQQETILYRVGTDWKDGKCVGQDNAFTSKENAIKRVNTLGDKYKVYDPEGKVVYEIKNEEPKPVEPTPNPVPVPTPTTNSGVEDKKYPDKPNEYKLCTGWKNGRPVNQKGAFTVYENARKEAIRLADKENKAYYVYNSKGTKLFYINPNANHKDIKDGYKVGTGYSGAHVTNQKGAFTKYDNAKNWADTLTKQEGKCYKVYLNGVLQYTSSNK